MSYLKQFTVFPSSNAGVPRFYLGLLSVKLATRFHPYAWVDNIRKSGKLSVTLTPCSQPIPPSAVHQMLDGLTGKKGANSQDLKDYLMSYAVRESQGFTSTTLAMLYRPDVSRTDLWGQLLPEDSLFPVPASASVQNSVPRAWSWELWTPPADLYLLLEQWLSTKYPKSLHARTQFEPPKYDKRRMANPRTTLTYLLEQVRAWDAQQTHYIEHPHPLLSYTAESFARLPQEQQTQLMADCQTWFSVHMLINLGTEEGEIVDSDWSMDQVSLLRHANTYEVQDGKVVDTLKAVVPGTPDDLAKYLQSLNG